MTIEPPDSGAPGSEAPGPEPASEPATSAAPAPEPASDEPLAVELCRLSLDLGRNRIRHGRQVGIAIRAAIFVELALDGRVAGRNWPEAVGDSDTGSPMPDAVHRAVAGRSRSISWNHWFNHVDADRKAAVDRLVASGAWTVEGRRIIDHTNGRTLLDQQRVALAAANDAGAPADLRDAVLVLLLLAAGSTGRPMPRRARKLARAWLPPMLTTSGRAGDAVWAVMLASIRQIHRSAPIRILSR